MGERSLVSFFVSAIVRSMLIKQSLLTRYVGYQSKVVFEVSLPDLSYRLLLE